MFALTALLQACADAPAAVDPAGAEAAALTENPNVSLVDERTQKLNDYFLGLPNWPTWVGVSLEVDMGKDSTDIGGGLLVCSVKQVDVKKNFDDIILIGANSGVMYPGAMIQGETLDDGTLSPLNLARFPLHVSIDMGVVDAYRHIENPNSATVQAAIAELQREADDRLGNLDVVPAQLQFLQKEVHSFGQLMAAAAISVRYRGLFARAGMDASFRTNRRRDAHTIVAKLYQPMYTVSFADDAHPTPADFFHPSVTIDDIILQQDLGTISTLNLPTYVKSVTYGRMMFFSMTRTGSDAITQMRAAIQASYGVMSGGAAVSVAQREIMRTSQIEMFAVGGTQEAALAAMRDGDPQKFLVPAPAATGVPISYRVNNLKDRRVARIQDALSFTIRECAQQNGNIFYVTIDSMIKLNRAFGCPDLSGRNPPAYWNLEGRAIYKTENYQLWNRVAPDPEIPRVFRSTAIRVPHASSEKFTIRSQLRLDKGAGFTKVPYSYTYRDGVVIFGACIGTRRTVSGFRWVQTSPPQVVSSKAETTDWTFPFEAEKYPFPIQHTISLPNVGQADACAVRFWYTVDRDLEFAPAPGIDGSDPIPAEFVTMEDLGVD